MRDRSAPLSRADLDALDWEKMEGLVPAIVQDASTRQVLMLGYMSREALEATLADGFATFFSRSKARLWRKGETTGHHLAVRSVHMDCDGDALLVLAEPAGPTCHLGTASCFSEEAAPGLGWLGQLSRIVRERAESGDERQLHRAPAGRGTAAHRPEGRRGGRRAGAGRRRRRPRPVHRGGGGPSLSSGRADAGAGIRLGRGHADAARAP